MIYCPGYRIGVAHGMLGLVLLQYFCLFGDCLNAGSNSRIASSYLALNSDGGLVGWGEIGSVPTNLDLTSGVKSVSSNPMAFAILKNNGDVVAYGEESNGGSIPSNVDVSNVISIIPSGGGNNRFVKSNSARGDGAFCALKSNGEVVTWGAENFGGKAPLGLKNVQRVYSTVGAFVALTRSDRNDPSNLTAVSWGSSYAGGVIPVGTVVSEVVDVFVNPYAYCLLLIQAGADVDKTDNKGATAMMMASRNDHAAIVEALLQAGADIDKAVNNGDTALIEASDRGHAAIVETLIQAGADIDKAEINGATALVMAILNGHAAIVETLLQAGADINKAVNNGDTALIAASEEGHAAIVEALLQVGADIDKAANNGDTALIGASREGHAAIVEALLQAGADIDKANNHGDTALMLASQKGRNAVVKVLEKAGAKR